MNFEAFWKWLLRHNGSYNNLGGGGVFEIETVEKAGTCIPQSTKNRHHFSKDQAKMTWDRYWTLAIKSEQHMAGRYVKGPRPHNWKLCPNRCPPWIAATIRDFLLAKNQRPTVKTKNHTI